MDQNFMGVDLSYLQPPDRVKLIIPDIYYHKHSEDEKPTRRIFGLVDFNEDENVSITQLKQKHQNLPQDWQDCDLLRMLYAAKFNIDEAAKRIEQHVIWQEQQSNLQLDEFSLDLLRNGALYLYGSDQQCRPIIILDAVKIDLKVHTDEIIVEALNYLLSTVKKRLFCPGKVENWIFILDTNQMGVFGLPLKTLKFVIDAMTQNFHTCLQKMYIVNPSNGLQITWEAIRVLIDSETQNKIIFITEKQFAEKLHNRIDLSSLEKKYGGTGPDLEFFWLFQFVIYLPTGYPVPPEQPENVEEEYASDHESLAVPTEKSQKLISISYFPVSQPEDESHASGVSRRSKYKVVLKGLNPEEDFPDMDELMLIKEGNTEEESQFRSGRCYSVSCQIY